LAYDGLFLVVADLTGAAVTGTGQVMAPSDTHQPCSPQLLKLSVRSDENCRAGYSVMHWKLTCEEGN